MVIISCILTITCAEKIFISAVIDKIMPHLDYLENGVITSYIPTVKRAEKKYVSAVYCSCERTA